MSAFDDLESRLTPLQVFAGLLLLIFAAKWPVLDQPPVWDGAMSVFPAAITLAHTDFDIAGLLDKPSYFDGGPNVHALSIVTWGTALAYWIIGDRPEIILPLLHLVQFVLAAWALTSLWRLAVHLFPRDELRKSLALGVVITIGVCPLFLVQAGYLYLELPILAFTAAALVAWVEGRTLSAAAWATLSALVKPSGMIVSGALTGCALLSPEPWRDRIRRTAALLAGPISFAVLVFSLLPEGIQSLATFRATLYSLKSMPDLMAILLAFSVLTPILRPWRSAVGLRARGDADPVSRPARASLACAGMLASFIALYLALVPLGASVVVLPRYYLQLLPFALLGLLSMLLVRFRRSTLTLLMVLCLFFLANRRGHLYPESSTPNFAIAERTMAYLDLYELQDAGLKELVERGREQEIPIFYGLNEHYRLTYPEMGYGIEPPAQGHCIYFEAPFRTGRLEFFPDSFLMLVDYAWLGGEVVLAVADQAQSEPDSQVSMRHLQVGRFESSLLQIQRQIPRSSPAVSP